MSSNWHHENRTVWNYFHETGSDPPVGSNYLKTLDPRRRFELLSLKFQLTTDVNVANRQVRIIMEEGSGEDLFSLFPINITANKTIRFCVATGYGAQQPAILGAYVNLSWGTDQVFAGSARIQIIVDGIQAGDQLSAIRIRTKQWLQPLR